jgi:hypothetical protein
MDLMACQLSFCFGAFSLSPHLKSFFRITHDFTNINNNLPVLCVPGFPGPKGDDGYPGVPGKLL